LTISIVSWDNGPAWGSFDYAYVTEISQSPTSSSMSIPSSSSMSRPSSSPSPSALGASVSSHHSHFVVGAAVGGTLAALVVIAIGFLFFLYFRRRRASRVMETEPNRMPFDTVNAGAQPPHAPQPFMTYSPTTPNQHSSIISSYGQNSQSPESPSSGDFLIPSMPSTNNVDSGDERSNARSFESPMKDPSYSSGLAYRSSSPHSTSGNSGNQLTTEQADFVHTLYSHNIPAPAIARVMESMIGRGEAGTSGENPAGVSGLGRENTNVTMPPRYTSDSSFSQ